jgi:hypothetical protein
MAVPPHCWSTWSDFSFLCSLVSRVASSTRAYLLAIANISSDVLGFFMMSLRIKDESLGPFLKNMMIDLSSTSGMNVSLIAKEMDELLKRLSLLLDDAS